MSGLALFAAALQTPDCIRHNRNFEITLEDGVTPEDIIQWQ